MHCWAFFRKCQDTLSEPQGSFDFQFLGINGEGFSFFRIAFEKAEKAQKRNGQVPLPSPRGGACGRQEGSWAEPSHAAGV